MLVIVVVDDVMGLGGRTIDGAVMVLILIWVVGDG